MNNAVSRNMITLGRILASGFKNFFRNAWLSTAATAVMVVTLTLLLGGLMINMALNRTIEQIATKIDISVYLEDGISAKKRQAMQQEIASLDNVKNVRFVSKDEAATTFRQQYEDQPDILEGLQEAQGALPASFEIEVYDLSKIDPIIAVTEKEAYQGGVESTSYDEERQVTVDRIAGAKNFITTASIAGSGIFAVISVLIIFNTIRMAVFTRSDELKIMRLIGATNNFIRGPFLFEASLYGIVAGLIAVGVSYSALLFLGPKVTGYIDFNYVIDLFTSYWPLVLVGTVAIGAFIGFVSSMFAMRRYLRL